jgi:phospholipase D1/2
VYSESTRFRSFAPIRRNISAKWFVGAKDYFSDLFFCLENAKSRLMIGDWFFSPGVYLKRGEPLDESTRLDRTLLRAAQRVRGCIIERSPFL